MCAEAGDVEAKERRRVAAAYGHVARTQGLAGCELDEEAPGGGMRHACQAAARHGPLLAGRTALELES